MEDKKQVVVELIMALQLQNAVQKDYLDAALEAALRNDLDDCAFFMQLIVDTETSNLEEIRSQIRGGKGRN